MKSELRLRDHDVLPDEKCIEVWHNGKLIGCVYGSDGPGVRIMTKYESTVVGDGEMLTEVIINPQRLV